MNAAQRLIFVCDDCQTRFESGGRLETWTSSLYGPCQEYLADCPQCGKPAKEYRVKSSSSSEDSGEGSCGEGACATPGTGFGGGGCGGCPCS